MLKKQKAVRKTYASHFPLNKLFGCAAFVFSILFTLLNSFVALLYAFIYSLTVSRFSRLAASYLFCNCIYLLRNITLPACWHSFVFAWENTCYSSPTVFVISICILTYIFTSMSVCI